MQMVEISNPSKCFKLKTASCPSHVGQVISNFSDFLRIHKVSNQSINQAIIVLRELLVNAIKHGNRYNKAFPVTICVNQIQENRFKISVTDFGAGFDYKSLDTKLPENPKEIKTRGFKLIKAYTDYFEFNQEGNRVTAYISTL